MNINLYIKLTLYKNFIYKFIYDFYIQNFTFLYRILRNFTFEFNIWIHKFISNINIIINIVNNTNIIINIFNNNNIIIIKIYYYYSYHQNYFHY